MFDTIFDTLFGSLSPFLRSLIVSLLIGLGGGLLALLVSGVFTRLSKKTWLRFFGSLIAAGIVIWTIKLILDEAGAVGVVVILGTTLVGAFTLGSEQIAADLVAGIKLFLTRPFKTGDFVSLAGQTGTVEEVTLTYTVLLGDPGDRVIIRNSDVMVGAIFNYSTQPAYRIEGKISIPANQDLTKAIPAIREAVKDFSPESAEEKYRPGVSCDIIKEGFMFLTVFAYVSAEQNLVDEKTRLMTVAFQALTQKKVELFARKE